MKRTTVIAALALAPLTACGGSADKAASPATAPTSTSPASAPCKAISPTTAAAKSAAPVKLASGLTVTAVQEVASTDDKSKHDVIVRVCGAPTAGDALKAQAQKIGAALKKANDAKSISSVRVTNIDKPDDQKARVRCDDFQMNAFAGADGTELATWKTADES